MTWDWGVTETANCRSLGFAPYEQTGLSVELRARRGNSRSLHYATPDFLWRLVAPGELYAPFYGKAHTLLRLAPRGRKSGYAPVGMTNSLHTKD
jgi:hypothetical protein